MTTAAASRYSNPTFAANEIDVRLASLDSALTGPRRVKADLLAEVRDGLDDAAQIYRREGWSAHEAAFRAVAEFGDLATVLPAFQVELAMAQAQRAARTLVAVPAAMFGLWIALRARGLLADDGAPPAWFARLGEASLAVGLATIALAALALALSRRPGRHARDTGLLRKFSAAATIAIGLQILMSIALAAATVALNPALAGSLIFLGACAASLTGLAITMVASTRCAASAVRLPKTARHRG